MDVKVLRRIAYYARKVAEQRSRRAGTETPRGKRLLAYKSRLNEICEEVAR